MPDRRRLATRLVSAVVAWALIVGFMAAGGLDPQPLMLAAAVAAVVAAGSLVSDIGARVSSANWNTEASAVPPSRGADPRVERLQRRVEAAGESGRVPELESLLTQLVIDQAEAVHGVSRERDGRAFVATVGPELAALVARHDAGSDRRTGMSTGQIRDLTERIEAL